MCFAAFVFFEFFSCSILVLLFLNFCINFFLFLYISSDLTFISGFFVVAVPLWVCCCSCFFARLQFGLLDLLRSIAFLVPLDYVIPDAPYQTALIGDQFS